MGEIKVLNCDCNQFIETEEFKELADSGRLVIVTDPPFNVGYHYGRYKDRMKADEYYAMLKRILTKADCPFVVILYPESLHRLSIELGYSPNRVVSWVYNSNTAKQHRDIGFYGFSPDFRKVRQPYKNPNDKRIKERMAKGMGGGRLYDWWNINQVKNVSKGDNTHPCVMPLEVMDKIVRLLPDDAIIFDPFSGSGTTGLACLKNGRQYVGCEMDAEYCKIQENRIKNFSTNFV